MFLCGFSISQAQHLQGSTKSNKELSIHQYFIYLSGIKERSDVLSLEKSIQAKPGVTFFMANRFPVRCFILKSTTPISKKEFETWIDKSKYQIEVYGSDEKDKELAFTHYIKTKKTTNE
jgi:hypothetical protein